jgi:hypothetical protein
MTQRLQRHPYLALFDGPDTNTTTAVRSESIVPLQALFLMNSPFMEEQAAALARRLLAVSSDCAERIRSAHRVAYGREPTAVESARGAAFVSRYQDELAGAGAISPEAREEQAWRSYARTILAANEFVYTD